jgi:hypothetical protein
LNGKVSSAGRLDVQELVTETQLQQFTSSSQPGYSPQFKAERSVASESSSGGGAAGCGLIAALGQRGGPGGGSFSNLSWVAIFLLLPVMLWFSLRQLGPQSRRRYDRFRMNSDIKVMVGGRELKGEMQTISLGGLSFNADEALEKGGILSMKITSPDGKEMVEVQGKIVWSEENHAYGVQFAQPPIRILDKINMWTRQLVRSVG